jgi:hypothetical protein
MPQTFPNPFTSGFKMLPDSFKEFYFCDAKLNMYS